MRLFKALLNEPIIPMIVMETVNQEVNPESVEDTSAHDDEEATTRTVECVYFLFFSSHRVKKALANPSTQPAPVWLCPGISYIFYLSIRGLFWEICF